jgi:hypothetical protein
MEYIFTWMIGSRNMLALCSPPSSQRIPTEFPIMTEDEEKTTQEMSFILNYISADVLATFLRDMTGRFVVCLATFWDVVGTFSNVG